MVPGVAESILELVYTGWCLVVAVCQQVCMFSVQNKKLVSRQWNLKIITQWATGPRTQTTTPLPVQAPLRWSLCTDLEQFLHTKLLSAIEVLSHGHAWTSELWKKGQYQIQIVYCINGKAQHISGQQKATHINIHVDSSRKIQQSPHHRSAK